MSFCHFYCQIRLYQSLDSLGHRWLEALPDQSYCLLAGWWRFAYIEVAPYHLAHHVRRQFRSKLAYGFQMSWVRRGRSVGVNFIWRHALASFGFWAHRHLSVETESDTPTCHQAPSTYQDPSAKSSIFALCLDTCIDFLSPSQIKILPRSNGAIRWACHEGAEVINVGRQQAALEVFSHGKNVLFFPHLKQATWKKIRSSFKFYALFSGMIFEVGRMLMGKKF